MSQGVLCKNCNNRVHPKLWHENMNSAIFNRSNQHICPICGVTMYTTGGGLTFIGSFIWHGIIALVIWLLTTKLIQFVFPFSDSISSNIGLFITILIVILYVAKRFFGFALSSLFKRKKPWE